MKIKNITKKIISFILAITLLTTPVYGEVDVIINFQDENLKQALLNVGVDTNGDTEISKAEAESIRFGLVLNNSNIFNIDDLGYFKNVQILHINNNNIKNIDVLENLPNLVDLDFSNNYVNNIEALRNSNNIQMLVFDNNHVNDFEPLDNIRDNLLYLSHTGNTPKPQEPQEPEIPQEELNYNDYFTGIKNVDYTLNKNSVEDFNFFKSFIIDAKNEMYNIYNTAIAEGKNIGPYSDYGDGDITINFDVDYGTGVYNKRGLDIVDKIDTLTEELYKNESIYNPIPVVNNEYILVINIEYLDFFEDEYEPWKTVKNQIGFKIVDVPEEQEIPEQPQEPTNPENPQEPEIPVEPVELENGKYEIEVITTNDMGDVIEDFVKDTTLTIVDKNITAEITFKDTIIDETPIKGKDITEIWTNDTTPTTGTGITGKVNVEDDSQTFIIELDELKETEITLNIDNEELDEPIITIIVNFDENTINKIEDTGNPDEENPTEPESPDEPEEPAEPETPANPDNPDGTDNPEQPQEPESPESPDEENGQTNPNDNDNENDENEPTNPEDIKNPDNPQKPENPKTDDNNKNNSGGSDGGGSSGGSGGLKEPTSPIIPEDGKYEIDIIVKDDKGNIIDDFVDTIITVDDDNITADITFKDTIIDETPIKSDDIIEVWVNDNNPTIGTGITGTTNPDNSKTFLIELDEIRETEITLNIESEELEEFIITIILDLNKGNLNKVEDIEPIIIIRDDLIVKKIKGYIKGYQDNTFRPENNITRAEIAQIISNITDGTHTANHQLKDIQDEWYSSAIEKVVSLGIMKGNENNEFRPNEYITRQDLAISLVNLLNKDESYGNIKVEIDDIINSYGKDSIELLIKLGVINGYQDNTFRPENYITRAEAVVLINRLLKDYIEININKEIKFTDIFSHWAYEAIKNSL